jgi:hypothetical protein
MYDHQHLSLFQLLSFTLSFIILALYIEKSFVVSSKIMSLKLKGNPSISVNIFSKLYLLIYDEIKRSTDKWTKIVVFVISPGWNSDKCWWSYIWSANMNDFGDKYIATFVSRQILCQQYEFEPDEYVYDAIKDEMRLLQFN